MITMQQLIDGRMPWRAIESMRREGQYGMMYTTMIMEADGKRILLQEGFGGMDTLEGGAYRWRHGIACALLPTDTLDSLTDRGPEHISTMEAAQLGYDTDRPILQIGAAEIERLAAATPVCKAE